MEGCVNLSNSWPGFTATQTIILPVDVRAWPPPMAPLLLDGRRFEPKAELHVTLIGSELGARVQQALAAHRFGESALERAFETLSWGYTRTALCARLAKLKHDPASPRTRVEVGALIEMIELPAMAGFHVELGNLLGASLPLPPPHVTLYTYGDAEGIGVPDAATLAALTVERLKLPR